jgi:inosine-uridine nucleoside N-ribohydrolase
MGGAIKVPGNKNRVAEFNIFVDPDAADVVFKSQLKKTIVPLDACNHVRLSLADFKDVKNVILRKDLLKMVKPYIDNIAKDEGVKAALMYDPLTVYYLINPKASRVFSCNIAIETKGELTRGMTVADLRKKPEAEDNTFVAEYIDAESFKDYFVSTLSKK